MDVYNLVSLAGLVVLMGVGWVFSADRRRMNWRVIGFGVGIQLLLGLLVFRAPGSRAAFEWANKAVGRVLDAAKLGQNFVFGPLATEGGFVLSEGVQSGFILGFQALPLVIFFAAVMALLYHWRVMPAIIRGFAWVFTRLMRVSGAESLCAASNIFVGIESATAVRPHLAKMTRSEFCTILTAGMATVASSTLVVYIGALEGIFPTIAGHLISASILSAPAAIVMSKILLPETDRPETLGASIELHYDREPGAMAAIVSGATAGVKLVVGIVALLIAFMGMVGVVNLALGAAGGAFEVELSLQILLGHVMRPFAFVTGVPWEDTALVGTMLGERLVATEIPAYFRLAGAIESGAFAHPRSAVVAAYSLCGFAHVASLAIFVGGVSALVPQRRRDLAAVGPRALLGATLACLMTGAVAGTFYHTAETVIRSAGR